MLLSCILVLITTIKVSCIIPYSNSDWGIAQLITDDLNSSTTDKQIFFIPFTSVQKTTPKVMIGIKQFSSQKNAQLIFNVKISENSISQESFNIILSTNNTNGLILLKINYFNIINEYSNIYVMEKEFTLINESYYEYNGNIYYEKTQQLNANKDQNKVIWSLVGHALNYSSPFYIYTKVTLMDSVQYKVCINISDDSYTNVIYMGIIFINLQKFDQSIHVSTDNIIITNNTNKQFKKQSLNNRSIFLGLTDLQMNQNSNFSWKIDNSSDEIEFQINSLQMLKYSSFMIAQSVNLTTNQTTNSTTNQNEDQQKFENTKEDSIQIWTIIFVLACIVFIFSIFAIVYNCCFKVNFIQVNYTSDDLREMPDIKF